ncbi:hypothetical protein [Leptolyngbya sp. KIOST-1]|uniref:hypothetical protein n=1 Tax=Leptolyngbya sp. KIOST-1 TaxID=1229172 RepID=UPI000A989658|nr:hypothetical protein [Leptolyngbya sp. KIOST-1]
MAVGLGLGAPALANPPDLSVVSDLEAIAAPVEFSVPCPQAAAELNEACAVSFAPLPSADGDPAAVVGTAAPGGLDLAQRTPAALALDPEAVAPALDLDPAVIEGSPTLRRWLNDIPDVASDIRHQPSFRPRLRVSYAQFPSSGQVGGFGAAVEDLFVVPGTGLTASADYSRSWNGDRESYGAEARYYLLPLGGYVNIAPTVGYRTLSTPAYQTDGLDVGLRLLLVPSRGGGADLALSQRWVAPGSENEVGITSLAIGYAVTRQLRLGTDFQLQNSRFGQDSRVGLSLELLL